MILAPAILALSASVFTNYVHVAASELHMATPEIYICDTETGPRDAFAWIPSDQRKLFMLRRWVVESADDAGAEYIARHEVCHFYYGDQMFNVTDEMEVRADDCVKARVSKQRWLEMEYSISTLSEILAKRHGD